MLFERFIQHQKLMLAIAAAVLMVTFLIGPALVGAFNPDEDERGGARLYGEEIGGLEFDNAQRRLLLTGYLVEWAYPQKSEYNEKRRWDTDGDAFTYRWLILTRMARENGLVVTDEEVKDLKDDFAVAWYERGVLRKEVESVETRDEKVAAGTKRMREYTKEWKGWSQDSYETTMREWALIRKLLSYLLEHEVKVSIEDVYQKYAKQNTEYRLEYVKLDGDEALARLEARTSPEELRRKALEAWFEKNRDADPIFRQASEVDFVYLVPDADKVRREVEAREVTEKDLNDYYGAHLEDFTEFGTLDAARPSVRAALADERVVQALRKAVQDADADYDRSRPAKTLAEVALEHELAYHRAVGVAADAVTATAYPDVDTRRLAQALFLDLQPGDSRVVTAQSRSLRPALVELIARRRVEGKTELRLEGTGELEISRSAGISPEVVLEAFFKANASRAAFARPATARIEVVLARRSTLARTIRVTTEDLERFYSQNQSRLFPEGEPPAFEAARLRIEPIHVQRRIQERSSGDLDLLRREFTEEDKKKRSFEIVAGREGYEYLALGPADRATLEAHPILGKAEGFADAVFGLEKDAVSNQVFESGDARFFFRLVEKTEPGAPTWDTVDRELVARELVRDHAREQAEKLLEEVYDTVQGVKGPYASMGDALRRAASIHGLEVHDTGRYKDLKDVPALKGGSRIITFTQEKEEGMIGEPIYEPTLEAAFLPVLVEKDPPAKESMPAGEIRQIRAELRQAAVDGFKKKWMTPESVMQTAERDLGIFKGPEK